MSLIDSVNQKIHEIDEEIQSRILNRQKDLEIVMSVPGIDFVSGVTILAEIGNYRDFSSPEMLASYFGFRARRGSNVAAVALARKILCILYHLLINQEMYEEVTIKRSKPSKHGISETSLSKEMTLEDMIRLVETDPNCKMTTNFS